MIACLSSLSAWLILLWTDGLKSNGTSNAGAGGADAGGGTDGAAGGAGNAAGACGTANFELYHDFTSCRWFLLEPELSEASISACPVLYLTSAQLHGLYHHYLCWPLLLLLPHRSYSISILLGPEPHSTA